MTTPGKTVWVSASETNASRRSTTNTLTTAAERAEQQRLDQRPLP